MMGQDKQMGDGGALMRSPKQRSATSLVRLCCRRQWCLAEDEGEAMRIVLDEEGGLDTRDEARKKQPKDGGNVYLVTSVAELDDGEE